MVSLDLTLEEEASMDWGYTFRGKCQRFHQEMFLQKLEISRTIYHLPVQIPGV